MSNSEKSGPSSGQAYAARDRVLRAHASAHPIDALTQLLYDVRREAIREVEERLMALPRLTKTQAVDVLRRMPAAPSSSQGEKP